MKLHTKYINFWQFFNYKLPFGPFIAIAAIVDVFFGQEIIALYVNTFWYG